MHVVIARQGDTRDTPYIHAGIENTARSAGIVEITGGSADQNIGQAIAVDVFEARVLLQARAGGGGWQMQVSAQRIRHEVRLRRKSRSAQVLVV